MKILPWYWFQSSQKKLSGPPKSAFFLAFLTKVNSKTKDFLLYKSDAKNGLFEWKTVGNPNFSVTVFLGQWFDTTVTTILLAADSKQCWLIFSKIQSAKTFAPYEKWSWNFREKIWDVTHGHFRNLWCFDMEWHFGYFGKLGHYQEIGPK